jgi:ABC-2 type transport system permease protein
MTRWQTVARKEVRSLFSERTPKLGIGLVALVFVFGGYIVPTTVPPVSDVTIVDLDQLLRGILVFLVPLFGLLLGYRAVVGERVGGQLVLLLSFPCSRLDVVLGKAIGRGVVLVGTITAGTLGAAALVEYPFGTVGLDTLAVFLGATVLYGVVFLMIGIGLSTVTASIRRGTVLTFAVFFLSVVAWPGLDGYFLQALQYVDLAGDTLPDWARFVYGAEPTLLYQRVMNTFVANVDSGPYLGPSAPWYLSGGVASVLLIAWVILPALGGYLQFRRTDL